MGLFVIALFAPGAAQAQVQGNARSASSSFNLAGHAVPVCILGALSPTGSANNATWTGTAVHLTQLLDPSTALVKQSGFTLQIANAMCNHNAWLSISSSSGGLVPAAARSVVSDPGSFLTQVPYTVQANWGSASVKLDTSVGKLAKVRTGGANIGNLTLSFTTQQSSLPVVAGSYSDVVNVKIGASL